MPERELVCIVCPNGCALKISVDDNGAVTNVAGNQCARGKTYAETEITCPVRTLTALVRVEDGEFAMCPVRSNKTIAKLPSLTAYHKSPYQCLFQLLL